MTNAEVVSTTISFLPWYKEIHPASRLFHCVSSQSMTMLRGELAFVKTFRLWRSKTLASPPLVVQSLNGQLELRHIVIELHKQEWYWSRLVFKCSSLIL